MNFKTSLLSTVVLAGSLLLTACGGDSSSNDDSVIQTIAGENVIPPGSSQKFTLTIEAESNTDIEALENTQISLITMLINTNDAFTGEKILIFLN